MVPDQEENITADIFAFHIIAVQFIVNLSKTCVEFGLGIGFRAIIDSTLASGFAEQSDGCVFQSPGPDRTALARIDRRRLPAGDDTALLFHKNTAFAVLCSAQMVTGVFLCELGFHTTENRCTKGELQEGAGSGVAVVCG